MPTRQHLSPLLASFLIVCLFVAAIALANILAQNEVARAAIASAGYLGVFLSALIAGLNAVVPIPAATFAPAFVAAGLAVPLVILTLALGTLAADIIGYLLGHVSRDAVKLRHPKTHDFLLRINSANLYLVMSVVFLYAAVIPLPNEIILIPLALGGLRLYRIIPPLLLGNLLNQAMLVYGVTSIFALLP